MDLTQQQLLQPSLGGERKHAPYSGTMIFLSAFFGGPLAALGGFVLNVQRLRRWRQDGLLLLPAVLFTLFLLALMQGMPWQGAVALRGMAMGLAVAGLWRHRREQTTADLLGSPRPTGLWVGLALVVCGNALTPLLEWLLR